MSCNSVTVTQPTNALTVLETSPKVTISAKGFVGPQGPAGSDFPETFETVAKNLKSYPSTFNYSGGNLSSIVYSLGGGLTITKSFNYTAGDLTSIVLSGDTPGGIPLTKTLSYSAGDLIGIVYA